MDVSYMIGKYIETIKRKKEMNTQYIRKLNRHIHREYFKTFSFFRGARSRLLGAALYADETFWRKNAELERYVKRYTHNRGNKDISIGGGHIMYLHDWPTKPPHFMRNIQRKIKHNEKDKYNYIFPDGNHWKLKKYPPEKDVYYDYKKMSKAISQ